MSKWNHGEWAALCSGEACPICLDGKPRGIILELAASYLTSTENGPMRGYCCLVLKRHAVELHELSADEACALMRDLQRVAAAVQEITEAVKLNYEIHGNTLPHLHVHLFPRYRGDPFEGGSINPELIKTSPYRGSEFTDFVKKLRAKLAEGTSH
jgi:diadenosine tetraphosphate (Ap4A) HIT family hydrolase